MTPWFVLFVVLVEGCGRVGASETITPTCHHLNQPVRTEKVNGEARLEIRNADHLEVERAPFNTTITIKTDCHVDLDEIVVRFFGTCLLTVSVVTEHGVQTLVGPYLSTHKVQGWTYEFYSLSRAAGIRDLHNSNGSYTIFVQFLANPKHRPHPCDVYPSRSTHIGVKVYAKDIDECADTNHRCQPQRCLNTIGSYQCHGCSGSCTSKTTPDRPSMQAVTTTIAPQQTTASLTETPLPAETSPHQITPEQIPTSVGGLSSGKTSESANVSTVTFSTNITTTPNGTPLMKKDAGSLLTSTHIILVVVLAVLLIALLVGILIAKQCKGGRLSCSMLCMCFRHPFRWCKSRARGSKPRNNRESSEETATEDTEPSAPALVSYRNIGHIGNVTIPELGPSISRKSSKSTTAGPSTKVFKTIAKDQQPTASQEASKEHACAAPKQTCTCAGEGTDPLYSAVGEDTRSCVSKRTNTGDVQAASENDPGGISNPLYALVYGPPVKSSTNSAESALAKDTRGYVNTTPNTGVGHAPYTNVPRGDSNPLYASSDTPRARPGSKSDGTGRIQEEADASDPGEPKPPLDDPAAQQSMGAEPSKGGKPRKTSAVPGAIYGQPVKSSKDGEPGRRRTHNLGKSAVSTKPDEEVLPPKVVPYEAHKTLKSSSAGDDIATGKPTSFLSSVLYQDPMDALVQEGGLPKQSRPSAEKDASLYASPFELQTRMTLGRAETFAEEEQSGDQQRATSVITAQSTTTTAVGAAATAAGYLSMASDASHAQSNTTNPPHGTDTESVTQGYASLSRDPSTTKTKAKPVVYSKVTVKPKKKGNKDQTAGTSEGATAGANSKSRGEQPADERKAGGGDVIYTQVDVKARKRSSMTDKATAS